MREKVVESRLVRKSKEKGGWAVKWSPVGLRGMPDRIVLQAGGKIAFVETKAPGKDPRPLQESRMRRLKGLGFRCYVADTPEKVDAFIEEFFGKEGDAE